MSKYIDDVSQDDLRIIAEIGRIAINSRFMAKTLEESRGGGMKRYIDRDLIERRIHATMDMQDLYLPIHFIQLMDELDDADVVEVVRCKDCAHYREAHKDGFGDCVFENWSKFALQNDYCSCGERREVTE